MKIGKVDYQDTGADSGKISLSGVGDPNGRILLFYDEEQIGQAVVGDDGTWSVEIEKKLGSGEHTTPRRHLRHQDGHGGRARLGQHRTRGSA